MAQCSLQLVAQLQGADVALFPDVKADKELRLCRNSSRTQKGFYNNPQRLDVQSNQSTFKAKK